MHYKLHFKYCTLILLCCYFMSACHNQSRGFENRLTMPRGRILPRSVQTHPNGEDPEWTNHVSGTQNYP